ncbi:potassium channel family protein [Nocardia sp. Marseille-Q1738]
MSTANGSHSGSAGDRRWVLRRALLPPIVTITALLLAYFSLPFTRISGMHTLVLLLIGLAAVGVVAAWQIRQVLRARDPVAQALQALTATFGFYLVGYATVYVVLSHAAPGDFSEPLTRIDALYFCVTVFTTVGFGDIVATSETSRAVVLTQMIGNLVLIGLVIRLLVHSVRIRREQLHRSGPFATGNSEGR